MTTAAYTAEKSEEFKGLHLLKEIVAFSDGAKVPGFEAFFRSKEAAIFHARSMMGNDGDTLSDETGLLECISRKEGVLTVCSPQKGSVS